VFDQSREIPRLVRRLVSSLPLNINPWVRPRQAEQDLMTFENDTDDEIQLLSEYLNRAHEAASTEVIASHNGILVDATLTSSSSSDDNWAGDSEDEVLEPSRMRQPLKPAIHKFNAEGVSPEAFHAFSGLLEIEAFHNATTFREQVALSVEHLRPDGYQVRTVRLAKFSAYQKEQLCNIINDTDASEKKWTSFIHRWE
jgi:hypothetical protein